MPLAGPLGKELRDVSDLLARRREDAKKKRDSHEDTKMARNLEVKRYIFVSSCEIHSSPLAGRWRARFDVAQDKPRGHAALRTDSSAHAEKWVPKQVRDDDGREKREIRLAVDVAEADYAGGDFAVLVGFGEAVVAVGAGG